MSDKSTVRRTDKRERRPDTYHVYVRHDDVIYFYTADGTFVPELEKGRIYTDIEDALDVVNHMVEGRDLAREDEPRVIVNAWKWLGKPPPA